MKKIEIVPYEDAYYWEIYRWFEEREIDFPASFKDMPKTGSFVALLDGTPIGYGFIALTNSFVALLNHMITNPSISGYMSGVAIKCLLAKMDQYAKNAGCTVIMASYSAKSIGRVLKRFGYSDPKPHFISSRRTDLGA